MAQLNISGSFRMTARSRMKIISACVAAALAQWDAGSALADSAVGVDTALGNALNPPGRSAVPRPVDNDGFDTVRHSPTGQLYGVPYDNPGEVTRTAGGWEYTGGIEAGMIGGGAAGKNALFRKYKDLKNGAYLNYFEVEAEKPDSANFIQSFGGGAGRDDQFYGLQFGRHNDWKVKLFYNETIHVFTDNWKSLFSGEGTGDLTSGLPAPTAVKTGNPAVGATPLVACTSAAPCWSYGGKTYSNATALAAINGITGTPNPTTGAITAGSPQSNMAKAISDKLATTPESELSLVRKKGGVRVEARLDDFWQGYASYSQEARKGARPFAMNEGNVSYEIAEPIDYTTHEFLAGLQYVNSLTQANLRVSLSQFRNNISTLNVQDSLLSEVTGNAASQTATYALNPDNNAVNIKGEFARQLPDFYRGRFTAAVSWGSNRQDEALLAPISLAQNAQIAAAGLTTWLGNNIGYAANSALVSNWNTTAALSQQTSRQRIDNKLIDLGLSLRPIDDLLVKGSVRGYATANKGGYMAYNPLTGQFGRGFVDGNNLTALDTVVGLKPGATPGTAGSCYVPPGFSSNALIATCQFGLAGAVTTGTNVPIFGQARSTKQANYGVTADYDLTRTSSVNAALEREDFKRDFRERDKTWEDKLKIGYVNRALADASWTLRTTFEADHKRGGEYRYRTFEDLGQALPGLDVQTLITKAGVSGYPALAAGIFNRYSYYFRKYDQADRDQNVLNTRLNFQAREDLDLGATLQAKNMKYPDSFYGMEKDNQNSLTLDLNYQPSTDHAFNAFYSYQQGKKSMNLNSGVASAVNTGCTVANLNLFGYSACSDNINGDNGARPLSSAWSSESSDRNDVLGFGYQRTFGSLRFGIDYMYSRSTTDINYSYGNTAFSATAAAQAAAALIAGSALPSMTFVQHTLNLNLIIPIDKKLAIRIFDRYEIGRVKDWHYDNVIVGAVANYDSGTLLLDAGPQNYRGNIIGVLVQYKL
ncbi:MAG: MtrB/PioB family outer membrane beta-barrel protein [Proteobacteria bacterium]|nr:MtrB/PioB family outer membrane beta-barrel protein [Pseudomonadota bacterium]